MIIGIDEAGRGTLAGPVYAACCLISDDFDKSILDDSKKLNPKQREEARLRIVSNCAYGIGFATHKEIDETNILKATFLAMKRAFGRFLKNAETKNVDIGHAEIIVDGPFLPPFLNKWDGESLLKESEPDFSAFAIVKADSKIPAVMAASILAKTARDEIMLLADKKWPQYGYARHKGYGTLAHRHAIKNLGQSPIGRKTFSVS
ncbi:MAG TPA: ribonuclease HII [Spirochaetaceae bacterium]|nr:ribonuclease HII [Spirochaetaceae bacterium]